MAPTNKHDTSPASTVVLFAALAVTLIVSLVLVDLGSTVVTVLFNVVVPIFAAATAQAVINARAGG